MARQTIPDLLPGTLDMLIARTLQGDSLHGWAISERIEQISQDVLQERMSAAIGRAMTLA